ncbi:MAG: NADase-type glycan-binding domain-containing protein [Bacillota bacterium]
MHKKIMMAVFFMILLLGGIVNSSYGSENNNELCDYDKLYSNGSYETVIKQLIPAIKDYESAKKSFIISSTVCHARNLVADSYRMLGKYTQAGVWYALTIDGYFDLYATHCFNVMEQTSVIIGKMVEDQKTIPDHYDGRFKSNPLHERTLNVILFKLLDKSSVKQKQQYFRELASYDKNGDWVTQLTKFCAGDLPLEELWPSVPKEFMGTASTYAGFSLEVAGQVTKARDLYTQALSQKGSTNIELLLAANRLGLLSFKMIYSKQLSNIYAVKTSSAKLEENRLYSAYNLIDGDPKTAWVPTGNKSGIGEWVEFSFDEPMQVNSLNLTNGYAKSDESFTRNNRIKTVILEFGDGSKSKVTLKDTSKPQIIPVRKKTRTIRITISEVYKGTKYDDTCLSDVKLEFGK